MPWNKATQEEYKRNGKELETTLTDDEWKLIEPLLPAPVPKGRPRTTDLRAVFNAIQFITRTDSSGRYGMPMAPATSLLSSRHYRKDGLFGSVLLLQLAQ